MIWLYDRSLATLGVLEEYESFIATHTFSEPADFTAKLPFDAFADVEAAYFLQLDTSLDGRVYVIEHIERIDRVDTTEGGKPHVIVEGREASVLLHTRTVYGTQRFSAKKPGEIISALMATLTGSRAIANLSFGTGTTLGSAGDLQASWGDMGETVYEILRGAGLSIESRLDGTTIYLDVVSPVSEPDLNVGEAYDTGSGAGLVLDTAQWRNYAYVLGEGEGAARVIKIVDQTAGGERRELYVDARDLAKTVDGVTLSDAAYLAALEARGVAALADTRKIESADAELASSLPVGTVVWYDSGNWAAWLMSTKTTVTVQDGTVRYASTLGEPPPLLRKTLRRELAKSRGV